MLGDPIQRAALGYAQMTHAEATAVLQLGKAQAVFNPQAAHGLGSIGLGSPPKRTNSA